MAGTNDFGKNQKILDLLLKPKKDQPVIKEDQKALPVFIEPKSEEPEKVPLDESGQIPKSANRSVVKLNGIQISDTGEISKTRYFEMLKLQDGQYDDIEFTPEQAKRISMGMKHLSTGLNAAIPLTCSGPQCPFANSCVYQKENKAPIGRPCIVETQLVQYWTAGYVEEFNVNFNSLTELRMVSELAEFDIYEMRVTKYLAETHPTLLQTVITGYTSDGVPLENTEISRAFDLKERLKRNRMKVLEALVATRKDKVKIMTDSAGGASTAEKINELKKKIDSIKRDISQVDFIDAEVVNKK